MRELVQNNYNIILQRELNRITNDNCFFVIQSSKENERIKRNISSSNNARSKETKKSAKENGSSTSPFNTSNKDNVTLDKVKINLYMLILIYMF